MKLTNEEVENIAMLARLGLSKEEVARFTHQLTDILKYIDILNEANTDGVEPTSQITGLQNISENDELVPFVENPDELLKCSPLEVEARLIKVKNVF